MKIWEKKPEWCLPETPKKTQKVKCHSSEVQEPKSPVKSCPKEFKYQQKCHKNGSKRPPNWGNFVAKVPLLPTVSKTMNLAPKTLFSIHVYFNKEKFN